MAATSNDELAERTCIVHRQEMDEAALLRFVCSPDNHVVPDIRRKLPGRGVWVSLSREAVAEACRRKLFARALRTSCAADESLPDQVEQLLERDAIGLLALANKAGLVTQGFGKVEDAIGRGTVRLLLAASDGARRRSPEAFGSPSIGMRRRRTGRMLQFGAIGFGIGPGKCDTCSRGCGPACRKARGGSAQAEELSGPIAR